MTYHMLNPSTPITGGYVSAVNSWGLTSTQTLSSGQTLTGTGDLSYHPDVLVTARVVGGDATLFVDFSVDGGANYDTSIPYAMTDGVGEFHVVVKGNRTCRVRLTAGTASLTSVRIHTEFGAFRQPNSGLSTPVQQDADASTVRAITEEVGIASGLFTGYSIVNKFGTNSDIDTATVPEDIWENGGTYTGFPDSTLEAVEVLSSSANDASAGTGARTVRITGLDTNYNVLQETVTLNGTTPVDSVGQFRRVHTAQVLTAGSGGVNAGTITVRHTTTTANVFLTIAIGRNQSNSSGYTVPAGYTAYMRKVHVSIRGTAQANTPAAVEGNIWTRPFGGVFRSRRPFIVSSSYRMNDDIYGGLVFTEKSDIVLRVTATSGDNTSISGGYDLILVKN